MKDQMIPKSKRCGVLDCGREGPTSILCDRELLNNPHARLAYYWVRAMNGSEFRCCESCRPKFDRTVGLTWELINQ